MKNSMNAAVRVVLVAITKHGAHQAAQLAPALPQADVCTADKFAAAFAGCTNTVRAYTGALRDEMPALFSGYDQIVFFVSLGAVVRLIAPLLKGKDEDPGVIVVDDAGQFVIPVLSGHVGGANAWAEQVATLIGATPVLTTASDVGKTIPVDILGRELGWQVEAPKLNITRVSAHVVNGEPIAVVQEAGAGAWWTRPTPLPATSRSCSRCRPTSIASTASRTSTCRASPRCCGSRMLTCQPSSGSGCTNGWWSTGHRWDRTDGARSALPTGRGPGL
jgi:cobalt-precorrin 5A hydrolase